jgi:hypothetical protein
MPAFTFEKISPPSQPRSAPPDAPEKTLSEKRPREVIGAVLDRLAIARRRRERVHSSPISPKPPA